MNSTKIVCKPAGALDVNFPITKVDKERRLVSGFATLDNVDTAKEKVSATASERAFANWRGNVREMHQPLAVGRAVDVEVRKYLAEDGQEYSGVYVSAYISRGAQDTWEKVLDGTLTGFSIGGSVSKHDLEKRDGMTVRNITEYELTELSLVDNPCNQYANLMQIEKSVSGEVSLTGASVAELLDVYYNETTEEFLLAKASGPLDEPGYEFKGWIEDGPGRLENLKKLLGGNMSEETVSEVTEVAAEVKEQPSLDELFTKFSGEIGGRIDGMQELLKSSQGATDGLTDEVKTLSTGVQEVQKSAGELANTVQALEERLAKVESAGGVQKSGPVEEAEVEAEELDDSKIISKVYGGVFVPRSQFLRAGGAM